MTNHLQSILCHWYTQRDQYRWVLGTVIDIDGSNYRKIGAMILINELGQYHGLISGGCLEKSLLVDVKKVLTYDRPLRVCYDSSENSDSPLAMALGCGGKVTILLQPVSAVNNYQKLDFLYEALQARAPVSYGIGVSNDENLQGSVNQLLNSSETKVLMQTARNRLCKTRDGSELLIVDVRPQIHLLVFGGGIDAIPLVQMAGILGWRVTLVDSRTGYAQASSFASAHKLIHSPADALEVNEILHTIDSAIVMTHNVEMDAAAIRVLQNSSARYLGLLGPEHRKQKVLKRAGISVSKVELFGPMGINIGGDLPESIALGTLAQCHQVLDAKHQSLETNTMLANVFLSGRQVV